MTSHAAAHARLLERRAEAMRDAGERIEHAMALSAQADQIRRRYPQPLTGAQEVAAILWPTIAEFRRRAADEDVAPGVRLLLNSTADDLQRTLEPAHLR